MKRFWLFRSNLKIFEYYHQYKDLETFEKLCHDYYLLLPLWLLKENYFDEVIIWRLTDKLKDDIIFDVNGKPFIQKWVKSFDEVVNYPSPDFSLFRGGFPQYDKLVMKYRGKLGTTLYLGTGKRIYSQYGGEYDVYLQEDEKDFRENKNCLPFFKTASPYIFYPIEGTKIKYDICWPCNFTQIKYKGQKLFISEIAKSPYLQSLKIVHCGNKPEVGKQLCRRFGVTNIEFMGSVDRSHLNTTLNSSSFGLNLSNIQDGCPRVSTEVLMSGIPLILKEETRLLDLYKKHGVVMVNEKNLAKKIKEAIRNKDEYKRQAKWAIKNTISFDEVNKKNINTWKKI